VGHVELLSIVNILLIYLFSCSLHFFQVYPLITNTSLLLLTVCGAGSVHTMGTLKAVMMSFMVLALHSCCTSGVSSTNNELLKSANNLPSSKTSQSTTQSAVNRTAAAEEMMKSVELLTDNMVAESSTATATEQVVESNSFNKKSGSVPRKGAAKGNNYSHLYNLLCGTIMTLLIFPFP